MLTRDLVRNLKVVVEVFRENEILTTEAVAESSFEELELPVEFKTGKKALIRAAIKKAGELAASTRKAPTEESEVNGGWSHRLPK